MVIVCFLICLIIWLIYLIYSRSLEKPELHVKKKELPEVIAFLVDEIENTGDSASLSNYLEQLNIIMDNSYIYDESLLALKLKHS